MAQQVFNQWAPVAKAQNEQGQEVYLPFAGIHAQTRDGKDEVIVGAGNMVWTGSMWVPVSDQSRLPVEATLSGQIVDPDENAVRTTTVGLSWVSWDPFGVTVLVPAGTFVDSPYQMVNGFGHLGVLCRDIQGGGAARHQFRVLVYWAASDTPESGFSVPEVLIFDPSEENTAVTGLARAVPTKSQYVRFRLYNDSETDRTYHFHAMLRAS